MKFQVGQWGNSLAVKIPQHVAEALNIQANDAIEFTVSDGKLTLVPIRDQSNLTLDELLEQVIDPPESEVDWGSSVGEEVW